MSGKVPPLGSGSGCVLIWPGHSGHWVIQWLISGGPLGA